MSKRVRPTSGGNTSDSESSSDGQLELDRLKEAANNEFINDSLFNNGGCSKKNIDNSTNVQKPPVSLRTQDDDVQQYNGIYVTPQFQQFVSKHLSKVLDSQIREKKKKKVSKPKPEATGGIKLFSSSQEYVSCEIEERKQSRRSTKRKRDSSSESSESERARFSEVAVTSQWVMSKECTKGWTKSSKGKEIIINGKGVITGNTT